MPSVSSEPVFLPVQRQMLFAPRARFSPTESRLVSGPRFSWASAEPAAQASRFPSWSMFPVKHVFIWSLSLIPAVTRCISAFRIWMLSQSWSCERQALGLQKCPWAHVFLSQDTHHSLISGLSSRRHFTHYFLYSCPYFPLQFCLSQLCDSLGAGALGWAGLLPGVGGGGKEGLLRKRSSCLWWQLPYFIKGHSLDPSLLPSFSAWPEKPVI